jgi:hypothetical protein
MQSLSYQIPSQFLTISELARTPENPKFILVEEADFFRKSEQEDVRHFRDFSYS